MPSANNEWVMDKKVPYMCTPFHFPSELWCLMVLLKALGIMINKASDSGSPCLTPCVEEKKLEAFPLMINENEALDIHVLIHLHHVFEKPIF